MAVLCHGTREYTNDLRNCTCNNIFMFFKNHDLFKRGKKDKRPITHLDMSGVTGGQIVMNDEENKKFLEIYANHCKAKCIAYMVEMKSEIYKFFIDIDEKRVDVNWESVNRMNYIVTIQDAIRRFFPNLDAEENRKMFKCVMCAPVNAAVITRDEDGEQTGVKIGLHLHFPNLIVDKERALLFREACIAALQRDFPFSKEEMPEGWEGVVDYTVYEANGLRMLKSSKFFKCKCNKKLGCTECDGTKKITTERSYDVQYVLNGDDGSINDAETTKAKDNFVYAIELASIRVPKETKLDERFQKYVGCPSIKIVTKSYRGRTRRVHVDDEQGKKGIFVNRETENDLDLTDERLQILKGIFTRINEIYKHIEIKDAIWRGDSRKPYLCVRVDGEGSSWCRNKKGDHGSSTIWFMLTSTHAYQRCFCSKDYNNVNCRKYSSPAASLTQTESVILFDNAGKRGSQVFDLNSLWTPPAASAITQEKTETTLSRQQDNTHFHIPEMSNSDITNALKFDLVPNNRKPTKKHKRAKYETESELFGF